MFERDVSWVASCLKEKLQARSPVLGTIQTSPFEE
uniref:Uncharacterized protein n=1 Tax=Anguilla anguilla TaxID=7936 RepID=A0A0E9W202_ANGAN